MAFGKRYTFNPVPETINMLLVSYPQAGKSTFASQFIPNGKVGIVVNADNRFDEVVEDQAFAPLSDIKHEMVDPKRIYDITMQSMPDPEVGLFVIDSVTNIMEPIILRIQREVEEGTSKGARGYKEKADAMKYLQAAFSPWGVDTIWIYHYRDRGNAFGKTETTTSITELELARLNRNINIKCEIVIDKNGKRGVKVLEARGGRTGMIIWDDTGKFAGIRERLIQEVWGGLTKDEQDQITKDATWSSSDMAIAWAMEQSDANGGFFKDAQHAKNSLVKLYRELQEEMGDQFSQEILYEAWKQKVFVKIEEAKEDKDG